MEETKGKSSYKEATGKDNTSFLEVKENQGSLQGKDRVGTIIVSFCYIERIYLYCLCQNNKVFSRSQ